MKQKILKKLRGISKVVIKENLKHSDYLDIINENEASIKKGRNNIKKLWTSDVYICTE